MGQARVVLVVLATGVVTGAIWLFIWAWQLGSPVLVLFGVVCLPMGLVDVKVCAVDATWSGLKLIIRKERR